MKFQYLIKEGLPFVKQMPEREKPSTLNYKMGQQDKYYEDLEAYNNHIASLPEYLLSKLMPWEGRTDLELGKDFTYSCNADCPDADFGNCDHPSHCIRIAIPVEQDKADKSEVEHPVPDCPVCSYSFDSADHAQNCTNHTINTGKVDTEQGSDAIAFGVPLKHYASLCSLLTKKNNEINKLKTSLKGILSEPYGCPMCDSGKLRDSNKEHWDDCPFLIANNLLNGIPVENEHEMKLKSIAEQLCPYKDENSSYRKEWIETFIAGVEFQKNSDSKNHDATKINVFDLGSVAKEIKKRTL